MHTGVYSVNAVLQSLAAKLDHYFKVSTDALAVLSFLKLWYNSMTVPLLVIEFHKFHVSSFKFFHDCFHLLPASSESGHNFLQLSPTCRIAGKEDHRAWLLLLLYSCPDGAESPKQGFP